MCFSKMNVFADIVITKRIKDSEVSPQRRMKSSPLSELQEGRHGSERWANLAAFSERQTCFPFAAFPSTVTTDHI
jgi:hypothetical protein